MRGQQNTAWKVFTVWGPGLLYLVCNSPCKGSCRRRLSSGENHRSCWCRIPAPPHTPHCRKRHSLRREKGAGSESLSGAGGGAILTLSLSLALAGSSSPAPLYLALILTFTPTHHRPPRHSCGRGSTRHRIGRKHQCLHNTFSRPGTVRRTCTSLG